MPKLQDFMLATLSLFLLTQCDTEKERDGIRSVVSRPLELHAGNFLIGEWNYKNSIWYSSELSFHPNGTFTFHTQGCYGQQFSQGQWINIHGSIILTSFDPFKPTKLIEAIDTISDIGTHETNGKLKNDDDSFSFVGVEYFVPAPILPGPQDTIQVYFDKIQLQLRNDTLYSIGTSKLPQETKFHRIKTTDKQQTSLIN